MNYSDFVCKMLDSYVEHLSKKAIFVKQNSMSNETMRDILTDISSRTNIRILHHEYKIYEMKDAFEPFLAWIRECYHRYYEQMYTIEEFLCNAKVYSLQQEVLASYIRNDICNRQFEVMIEEYEYEQERFLLSLYNVLQYISKDEPLVLCIGKMHMAPVCVLKLVNYIFEHDNNIHFVFTYGETFLIKDYCKGEWEKLLRHANEENMILEWKHTNSYQTVDYPDEFLCVEGMIEEYIRLLTNMFHTFAFMDAKYYMNIVWANISKDTAKESDEDKLRFLLLMANIHIATGNGKECLFVCENMYSLISGKKDIYWEYVYNYLSAKAHLLVTESQLVYKYCDKCREIACKLNDEKLLMDVGILETITHFGGLREIFKCDYKYKINEDIIALIKKYNNENVLAYMYIFDADKDEETIRKIGNGEILAKRFNEGIAIAERLDNKNLLLLAYMKNIIIYSELGMHKYVAKMYEKRISIVDNNKPLRIAHMYGGLGYNAIVQEDYVKADEYLRKSVDILIECNKGEDLAETLYKYCLENNHLLKATLLNAKIRRVDYQVNRSFADKPLPVKAIIDNYAYIGVWDRLNSREKDIEFLTVCHDVMIREQNSVEDVVINSIDVIQNSYNFDRILLLERKGKKVDITFSYGRLNVEQKDIEEIFTFFDDYRTEFISSRVDKSFNVYSEITTKIGVDDIVTIVGIPVFVDGMISRIFIATVDIHRHFTGNRKLLSKSNLVIIKYAISQLDEAIKRIKKSNVIKRMNEELEKAAFTDQLTGIYNRMGFDRILKKDIANEGLVLYMDLDNFKGYNDTYGHDVGDLIIKEFAYILQRNVGRIGYAIRYGGDEFVAILPDKNVEDATNIANTIENQLKEDKAISVAIEGNPISASIGIARYQSATRRGLEEALKCADKALYEVKKNGKGKVTVYTGV